MCSMLSQERPCAHCSWCRKTYDGDASRIRLPSRPRLRQLTGHQGLHPALFFLVPFSAGTHARSRPWNRLAAVVHKNTCSAIDCCRATRLIGHLLFQCIDQVVGCTFLVTVQKKKKSTATPGAVPCARARSHPRDPFVRPTTL